ncbi:MAG TPA: 30S ribosomal protein S7 [Nitrososphaerales archaeon]|jgi:small subunit ribosomal protein S7|nr:30S ribosomal protein S7 [Nitrososphaerales archaeon]|tara:strand:+ start:8788 stop:9396 length:609 start_codon:yes stop_codon:yes gene_type:complete
MTPNNEELEILLFRKWDSQNVEIIDHGLKNTISLTPMIIPNSMGRHEHQKFQKATVNIVERLVNNIMHFGRRGAKNTGRMGGKKSRGLNIVETAFNIIQLRTNENPIQILVRAIENTAPNEDTTRIAYGGVVYHVSVDIAPIRRVDLSLRFISEGVREAAFSAPRSIEETLADEIILASNNDNNSYAIKKKNEQERIAIASR